MKNAQSVIDKATIGSEAKEEIHRKTLQINNQLYETATRYNIDSISKNIKIRLQIMDNYRKTKQAKKEEKYFDSICAMKTWDEQLQSIEKEEPIYFGRKLSVEQAINLKNFFEEKNDFLNMEEMAVALNISPDDETQYKELIVRNLPVVLLKRKEMEEVFVDSRQFLKDPSLIVDLYSSQEKFKVFIEFTNLTVFNFYFVEYG